MKRLPYPWRSIVDAGVVVGLSYGALSIAVRFWGSPDWVTFSKEIWALPVFYGRLYGAFRAIPVKKNSDGPLLNLPYLRWPQLWRFIHRGKTLEVPRLGLFSRIIDP